MGRHRPLAFEGLPKERTTRCLTPGNSSSRTLHSGKPNASNQILESGVGVQRVPNGVYHER